MPHFTTLYSHDTLLHNNRAAFKFQFTECFPWNAICINITKCDFILNVTFFSFVRKVERNSKINNLI